MLCRYLPPVGHGRRCIVYTQINLVLCSTCTIFAFGFKTDDMKSDNEQIKRIQQMERRLDTALAAVKRLTAALDKWEAAQEAISALGEYYESDLWKQDFADDEAGLLPADLKRGVLSEDGIWNLLVDVRELNYLLNVTAKKKK